MIREGALPEACPRPAHWTEIPRNCAALRDLAEDYGWATETVYTRGAGTGPRVVDMVVLRMQREDRWIAAVYHDGRFRSGIQLHPPKLFNAKGCKQAVMASDPVVSDAEAEVWPPLLADDPAQNVRWEYELMDFHVSGHPLDYVNMRRYPDVVEARDVVSEDGRFAVGDKVQLLGIVEQPVVKRTRRSNTLIGFFGVSDLNGMAQCLTFGEDNCKLLVGGTLVHAKGVIEERDEERLVKVFSLREVGW